MSFLRDVAIHLTVRRAAVAFVTVPSCLLALMAPAAFAASEGSPQWTVTAVSAPTNFRPSSTGEDVYRVAVENTGGADSDGGPVRITDELPEGLTLSSKGASGRDILAFYKGEGSGSVKFKCVYLTCTYTGTVVPDDPLILEFPVDVAASPPSSCEVPLEAVSCVTNVVRVSGGGALDAFMSTPTTISATPAGFGISPGGATTALSTDQAGAATDITTTVAFNSVNATGSLAQDTKDLITEEPPGFAGDLVDTPTCTPAQFGEKKCPLDSQIGMTVVVLTGPVGSQSTYAQPLYNLSPNPDEVAKFGFVVAENDFIQGNVRVRPGDYGLTVSFHDTQENLLELDYVTLTVWGVPGDSSHDPWRWATGEGTTQSTGSFGHAAETAPVPYFINPTSCEGEGTHLKTLFRITSWQHPDESESPPPTEMLFGPISGCDRLNLPTTFSAVPSTVNSEAPTGLDVNLGVEQTYDNAYGLATSALKKAVVTLPEGMTVNPSAGTGLGACSQAQYEEEGLEISATRGCPNDSTLGSVTVETPALKEKGTGSVFLAQPYANPFHSLEHPFGSLIALYIVIRFPERGVIAKLAGEVAPNPVTGRLVTSFEGVPLNQKPYLLGLPPVPFSSFQFKFIQGPTSPLVSPPACGSYQINAALTPYSEPENVLSELAPAWSITQGFEENSPCPSGGVPPFKPGISAGTLNEDAGSYSPLDVRITRNDGEQEITGFSSQLPPGLTANLTGVPFCSEADIALARTKSGAQEEAEPACPAASEIGHSLVGAGVGSVLAYAPGKLYMAGPFDGAPFSIAAITSAKVGPFDLGTVVVHLPLYINPLTAAVSIPAGAAAQIPHIIRGIVVHVRDIRVYVDRSDFTLNPTSCARMSFSATVDGGGADPTNPAAEDPVTVTNPFQAADCSNLQFKPTFKVSTSGSTSRTDGASLSVKLAYPKAPQGSQANIRAVKVDLPKQLPSRLTTLQKACTEQTFNANPANCPAASIIGHATAVTPILPVALTGPAYFVSYGGAKFPELVIVLQGYGVTIDLHGETFIDKAGITSSTFRTIPDQPVTSFELTLPEGKYSALAANGNLCRSKLTMPTAFTAQNGAVIHQSTPIVVTGCVKHKAKQKAGKKAKTKKAKARKP